MIRLPALELPADVLSRAHNLSLAPGRPTGIYARESDATERKNARKRTDVVGQVRRVLALLESTPNVQLAGVYVETRSAFTAGKRSEFTALLADVDSGAVRVVAVSRTDRVARNRDDGHEFGRVAIPHGLLLITDTDGDYDFATRQGQDDFDGEIIGARRESRKKRDRARDRNREQWDLQIQSGGAAGFGYRVVDRDDGLGKTRVPEPGEFEALRQAADDILDPGRGVTAYAIAARWNAAELWTIAGNPWTPEGVARMLKRPYVAGLWSFRGGPLVEAPWPAAISRAKWEALCERLSSPVKGSTEPNRRYKASLLGVSTYLCGRCYGGCKIRPDGHSTHLLSGGSDPKAKGVSRYRCRCCHMERHASNIDDHVLKSARDYLSEHNESVFDMFFDENESALVGRITALDQRLAELEKPEMARVLTGEEIETLHRPMRAERRGLLEQLDKLRAEQNRLWHSQTGPDQFDTWPMERQRQFVARTFVVTVLPAPRGRKGFDPSTVTVERRQS